MSKPGRNDPCPCGSGKKYKQCCLGKASVAQEPAPAELTPESPIVLQAMQTAIELHRTGKYAEAEALYGKVLEQVPRHSDALHLSGVIAYHAGKHDRGLELIRRAIEIRGSDPGYHNNLGLVYEALHRPQEAAAAYRKAIALNSSFADPWCNLGYLLTERDDIAEAVRCLRRAIALRPDFAEAWCNLGRAFSHRGNLKEAASHCEKAVALNPDLSEAWLNLGNVYHKQDRLDDAVVCFRKALALNPNYPEAYFNLATALVYQGNPGEAEGNCYKGLSLKPDNSEGHRCLAYALLYQGDPDGAIESCEKALSVDPNDAAAFDTRLMAMLYRAGSTPGEILNQHRRYAERFEIPLKPLWPRHGHRRHSERRLKVGYVSPDFRTHSVAYFIEPLLAGHDRSQFEIHAYFTHTQGDRLTERIAALVDHWTPCAGLSDAQLAERICADGINILVDLAGHTSGNRLQAFARKPAPIQVSYLGYPVTTGLAAMDYRLTTATIDPAGSEQWYSERLWRLPRTLWCYRPPADMSDVSPRTPASAGGMITFGSMNNVVKVSPETIARWAEILRGMPGSRLVMTSVPAGSAQRRIKEQFARHSIAADRLRLHGRLPTSELRAIWSEVDVALDPFPYSGTTTTCEALWLGIPVVTMAGQSAVARSGLALLTAVGLSELCGRDEAEYVRIALGLAGDLPRLESLRQGMRGRLEASPLRDEAGFARDLEQAYRGMWTAREAGATAAMPRP